MQQVPDKAPLEAPLHFDAVLRPHRSLGPNGFLIVMTFVGLVSFIAGIAFVRMGAWPVFGFFGLDVALIYFAFKLNYRAGRAFETVQLSDATLKIRKVAADGTATAWTLEPYWARVRFDPADEEDVAVEVTSHGKRLVLGAFLSPEERVEFGEALRAELERHRTRDFAGNPA
ncbi:MAG: DUF2244 domain-containing protein [Parvibaculaceae bacterium]